MYNLAPAQCDLWLQQQDAICNNQGVLCIEGTIDTTRLLAVIKEELSKQEIARTRLISQKGNLFPLLEVIEENEGTFKIIELVMPCGEENTGVQLEELLSKIRGEKIDIWAAPVIRMHLIRINAALAYLVCTIPTLFCDTHSLGYLFQAIAGSYGSEGLTPAQPVIQYPQFAGWQNEMMDNKDEESDAFWKKHVPEICEVIQSPYSQYTASPDGRQPGVFNQTLARDIDNRLQQLTKEKGIPLQHLVLAAVALLHYYYTGKGCNIGYIHSKRMYEELEATFGLVAKTLPLPLNDFDNASFFDLARKMAASIEEMVAWQDNYAGITYLPRSSDDRLYRYSYGFEHIDLSSTLHRSAAVHFSYMHIHNWMEGFGLKVSLVQKPDSIQLSFLYDTSLYCSNEIKEYAAQLVSLLDQVAATGEHPVAVMKASHTGDKARKTLAFNHKVPEFNSGTLSEILNRQVIAHPQKVAVLFGDEKISYEELDRKARNLAAFLRNAGVDRDTPVGLKAARSIEMIVGIVGILYAGGAYVPIDPMYPEERIRFMLADSGITILLTDEGPSTKEETCYQVDLKDASLYEQPYPLVITKPESTDLAYIIYTSGSTGKPKGVMVEQRSVVSLVQSLDTLVYGELGEDIVVGLIAPFGFDGSVKQLFASLLAGRTLCIIPDEIKNDGVLLADFFNQGLIDVCDVTPVHINMLLGEEIVNTRLGIKYLLCGGQALPVSSLKRLYEKYQDDFQLINVYGPTECCVDAAAYAINRKNVSKHATIPIGRPILNSSIYILNEAFEPVPVGVVGEIYIGGAGVARGYQNAASLTAQKFIQIPSIDKGRVYRTGDFGKWLSDGSIEFMGRKDDQVKFKGLRIELPEIEENVRSMPGIEDAVVAVKNDDQNGQMLIAYVVANKTISVSELIAFLRNRLPSFMIPSLFVQLPSLPITAHGKVDRKNLPDPKGMIMQSKTEFVAPQSAVEIILADIWCELLAKERIGIHDDFYESGGDSIKAIQVSARLYKKGYQTAIKNILLNPTIDKLAPYVTPINADNVLAEPAMTEIPLSPMQLDFFYHNQTDRHYFNNALVFFTSLDLDRNEVEAIFIKLVEHHDLLRATFSQRDGRIIQTITRTPATIHVQSFDLRLETPENSKASFLNEVNKIQASIDLQNGPLFKIALFQMHDGYRLLFIVHHLVVDNYSWRILLEDLIALEKQNRSGKELILDGKTGSFASYTAGLYELATTSSFKKRTSHWQNIQSKKSIFADTLPAAAFEDAQKLFLMVDETTTMLLLHKANEAFQTEPHDLLLTALGSAVKQIWQCDQAAVWLEGHGRSSSYSDVNVSRTVGWFSCLFPFIIDVIDASPRSLVQQIKAKRLSIPEGGVEYGIYRHIAADAGGNAHHFKADFLFNYLGVIDTHEAGGSFSIESAVGETRSPAIKMQAPVVINVSVSNAQLCIEMIYSRRHVSEMDMTRFAASFVTALQNIANYFVAGLEKVVPLLNA